MPRRLIALLALLVVVGLAGCGNKGPLYLPEPESNPAKAAPAQGED